MSYYIASEQRSEIVIQSKRAKRGCAPFFIGGVFLVFILVGYILIPKSFVPYYFPILVFLVTIFYFVFRKKKRKQNEFEKLIFSARSGAIELKGFGSNEKTTIAFNEIAFFDVHTYEVQKRTTGNKTTVTYKYAIRMYLKDSSHWMLCTLDDQTEAEETADRLKAFCRRHQREGMSSKGFVPKRIRQTRLGSNNYEFRWSNRNVISFVFFVVVSLLMTAFFGYIIVSLFRGADSWLDSIVAVVFSFFFLLIFAFIQAMELPKQLRSMLYDFELHMDRKVIHLDGVKKNGKRKAFFQGDIQSSQQFILSHFASDFFNSEERTIQFMTPRIKFGEEVEKKNVSEHLKSEFEQLRSAQQIPLNHLKLLEVMAFRTYLNEIIAGIRA